MAKLSTEEIRIAAKAVSDEYYENGYNAARKKADKLQAIMVTHDNVDPESIYEFEKYSGMTYRK